METLTGPGALLVAHRGFSAKYPENTLVAIEAALKLGARYVEFDVHLTQDAVPVVLHDSDLFRTTGRHAHIQSLSRTALADFNANFSSRFGQHFAFEPIPSLSECVALLQRWGAVSAFVELKRDSIRRFGAEFFLQRVLSALQPVLQRTILISFDEAILQLAKQADQIAIGWIFEDWTSPWNAVAERLQPQFLLTDYQSVPDRITRLPQGPWQWVVYEIDDPAVAQSWLSCGADFVETNDIGTLLGYLP